MRGHLLRPLCLIALALSLSGPVALAGGDEEPAPPPTAEELAEAFTGFTEAITSGDKEAALDALVAIIQDPEQSAFHGAAYAQVGNILASMDYPYAALTAIAKGIRLDPTNAAASVPKAMELATLLEDEALLELVFAENVGLDVPSELRGQMAWLAARGAHSEKSYSTALGILSLVGTDSPDYARAQSLKGVILSRQGRYTDAMAALQIAASAAPDDDTLDVINLNLARTYYAAENYPRSIEYYAKVSRDSHWWPEAAFERAWAHFRITDVNGALGLLHNHSSPFYKDWYFPEAHILRIYSLFLLCKFPEASRQIDEFQTTWTPIRDELKEALAPMGALDVFKDARAYLAGEDTKLPEMVLRDLPYDERLEHAIQAVAKAKKEIERLESREGAWAALGAELVTERRSELAKKEGRRLHAGVEARVNELTGMLNDTELGKLDLLRLEKILFEQAAASGVMPDARETAMRDVRVRKGQRHWPYEGEIWADELGYYRVNAQPECPAGLMSGVTSK